MSFTGIPPTELSSLCTSLQEEQSILRKLLYRNKNQHRACPHYCNMLKISKSMGYFPFDLLHPIIETSQQCLRYNDIKVSREEITVAKDVLPDLGKLVVILNEICIWCQRGYISCEQQLIKKNFVALLSIFVSIAARIFRLSHDLLMYVNKLEASLKLKLIQIGSKNRKHSYLAEEFPVETVVHLPLIDESLDAVSFSGEKDDIGVSLTLNFGNNENHRFSCLGIDSMLSGENTLIRIKDESTYTVQDFKELDEIDEIFGGLS